jgi:hypothetical protein
MTPTKEKTMFTVGQTVKFAEPMDESESTCRMKIIELRGDRALVSDDMHTDWNITPTSVYLLSELEAA